jgi:hypothetical protein
MGFPPMLRLEYKETNTTKRKKDYQKKTHIITVKKSQQESKYNKG